MKESKGRKIKVSILLLLFCFIAFSLMAKTVVQEKNVKQNEIVISSNEEPSNVYFYSTTETNNAADAKKVIVQVKKVENVQSINSTSERKKAFMGVYTEELSLKDIRALEYPQTYGVLITGVSKNSNAYHYGLLKDDILMQIGDNEITDKNKMTNVINSYVAGDSVTIKIFRLGKEKTMPFVFGSKEEKVVVSEDDQDFTFGDEFPIFTKNKKSSKSTGFGGGTWMPIWTMIDMKDVNELLTRMSFNKLDENGILLNGGGGKITIGKGLFIGGMGAGYTIDRKSNIKISNLSSSTLNDSIMVSRRMKYHNYFWAVTLDKRYAITKNLISSIGFGIGAAGQSIEISQNGDQFDWDNLQNQFGKVYNNYVNLSKDYIIVHPKIELMYRLTSWLALRAEGGYVYGYSWHNDWKNSVCGDTYSVTGKDNNTKYEGLTVSVGPWFGF